MNLLFRHDLLKHFFVGFFIYVAVAIVSTALIITAIIAICKELIYDKAMSKGKAEMLDVIYTVAPAVIMNVI